MIIGGGPSGLLAAEALSSRGHDVLVVEEHEEIGKPDHCAGLLSITGLKVLGLKPPNSVIQNAVSGASIHSPSGYHLSVERGSREALVVDRSLFDQWLAETAERAGAHLATSTKAVTARIHPRRGCVIELGKGSQREEIRTRALVNAEGSRGAVARILGLPDVPRSSKFPAYQYELSNVDVEPHTVEMFYSRKYAPGFFAWIIPLGGGRARVGLAAKTKSKTRLDAAIRKHPVMSRRLERASVERGMGGTVLVGLPVSRLSAERVITVGDAAGMVKATTGGGVIMGGITAKAAGQMLANALESNNLSAKHLFGYDKEVKALVMKELRLMWLAQRALTALSDPGLDTVIRDAQTLGLLDIVKKEGDMDLQGRVIERLLKNPKMFLLGLRAIRYINPFMS